MDWLSIVGNLASVVGLAVSCYTLYKVQSLPEALRHQSRSRQVTDLIDRICQASSRKTKLTEDVVLQIEFIIRTVRLYYVEGRSAKHRELASLLEALEMEIGSEKRTEAVRHQLLLIRDEITIR